RCLTTSLRRRGVPMTRCCRTAAVRAHRCAGAGSSMNCWGESDSRTSGGCGSGKSCRAARRPLQFFLPDYHRAIGPDVEGEPMPHTRSAKKNLRKSEKRRLRNRAAKSAIKTQLKKVMAVAKEGTVEQLKAEVIVATKKLDKAAAKRIVHPNLAARKKSQLGKLLHQKGTGGKTAPGGG